MEDVQHILATNLRLARAQFAISQEDLAELSGIDRTYVSGVERGVRNPTIKVLARLALGLRVPVHMLLTKDAFASKS